MTELSTDVLSLFEVWCLRIVFENKVHKCTMQKPAVMTYRFLRSLGERSCLILTTDIG